MGLASIVICLAAQIFATPILKLLQTPDELMDMTLTYVRVIFWGIVFVYLYNYFAFLLRSMGESVVPLIFLGVASVINVVLDLLFVVGFSFGIAGAAWATVLAQIISGVGICVYTWTKYPSLRFSLGEFWADEKPAGEILRFSFASSLQQSIMNFGILMVQGLVNSFGVSVMAAFAAGVKIDTLAYMPAQEFGNAYSIFLSQNYGAGQKERVKKGTKTAFLATVVFCLVISAGIFGADGIWWSISIGWMLADIAGAYLLFLRKK